MSNFKCTILAVALKELFVRLALNIIYVYVSEESYVRPKSHRHGARAPLYRCYRNTRIRLCLLLDSFDEQQP